MDSSIAKSGPPLLRFAHGLAFAGFLHRVGAPVDRHLRRAKLPVLCDDPDVFVPLARVWAFLATAARHEGPTVGWQVGEHVGDHNLAAGLLRKLETAPTLLQALRRFVQLARSEASHIQLGLLERGDDVLLYTHYSGGRKEPGYMTSQAYQLEVFLDLIQHFLGSDWVPEEIGIERLRAPAIAAEHFPGSRILTQQPVGYIAVPRACLHRAARRTEPESGVADDPVPRESFNYIDKLRAVLKAYLPDGYPSARVAAELMGVSERTLARRLGDFGLTYGSLIDEVRFAEAKKLLQNPGSRIGDVAMAVGFDTQTNFTRMFRRVGGLTPKEFRKAMQS